LMSNGCTAALQKGAPTPMLGYCPTRAGLTPVTAPRSPAVAWRTTLVPDENPENYLPFETVVDSSGRAYVGVYSSPESPTTSFEIVALDPDGSAAWRTDLSPGSGSDGGPTAAPPAGLAIGSDGTLWGPVVNGMAANPAYDLDGDLIDAGMSTPTTMLGVGRDGTIAERIVVTPPPGLPSPDAGTTCSPGFCQPDTPDASFDASLPADFAVAIVNAMVIGSDGSFYVLANGLPQLYESGGLARILPDGSTAWAWTRDTFPVQGPLLLTPTDDPVVATHYDLQSFSSEGAGQWEGPSSSVQVLGPDGDAVGLSQPNPDGELTITRLDASGHTAMQVSLGSPMVTFDASHLAVAADGTILVLLASENLTPGSRQTQLQIIAVDDHSGATRWTSSFTFPLLYDPSGPSAHYGLFVDPAGTIVVTAGSVMGLDLATGSTLWTLQPPNPNACLRPAVLGAGGSILAAQCDGTLFLARDP
jgi:hypothetical protein